MNSFENTKVLITLMGLEIGGAETHVLELCKALKERGLDIYVASNGGAYEAELISHGCKHFKVPLHNKKATNLLTSYFALKRIIADNDIRLVHAHARIPAFLCGMLQKKLGFTFVTTAHLNFDLAVHYRVLTNWGDATLAVSQDIRDYLIDNYEIDKRNIIVSVNGINTRNYNNNINISDISEEFDLLPGKKRIVFVGRLDDDASSPAPAVHNLVEIAEDIHNKNDATEIVIVGGGTEFDAIKTKADAVNTALGKQYIKMTGGRTDAAKFMVAADIFVGVSRAALEAMACAKPVILAGRQGYLGVFDKDAFDAAVSTNFTCRGHEQTSVDSLKRDIFTLLDASPDKLKDLGDFSKKTIDDNYSMDKLADDTLHLYHSVRKSPKPIDALISGYYGSNNHGDDALLDAITSHLREYNPDINIAVVTKQPKETKEIYNVQGIYKFNFLKIISALRKTNVLIMGGGSLLQDSTSTKSLIYYIFVMYIAARTRAKIMLYANGIGPLRHDKNKRRAIKALERAHLITLRDNNSNKILQSLNLKNKNVHVTADPVFAFGNTSPDIGQQKLDEIGIAGKRFYCVAIRNWKTLKEDFSAEMAVFCDYLHEKHDLQPLFIPMQPSNDAEISASVLERMKTRGYYLEGDFSITEILSVIGRAEFLMGMRLHSIIYGINCNTPIIGLVYDPKVEALFEQLDLPYYMAVEDVVGSKLISCAEDVLEHKDEIAAKLALAYKPLASAALVNAKMAYDIVNRDLF